MAWTERTDKRGRTSKVWQDGSRHALYSTVSTPLHYGDDNALIDMRPIRVDNAGFDGWFINNSGWHYALGKIAGESDGWVGFGGRSGKNWFRFRLARVGYLHYPTRGFRDLGGAPNYDRSNLSSDLRSVDIGPDGAKQTVYVETAVTWSSLWSTPGGGDVSVRWRLDGRRLKEDVILNEAARNWLAANRPPTKPARETYFVFVYEVDWDDIPKRIVNDLVRGADDDFTDTDGGVEMRNELDELIAFMPLDDLFVVADGEVIDQTPLRKRFYTVNGKRYLAVGARVDTLAALPAGDFVFDPSVTDQVGSGANDGVASGNLLFATNTELRVGNNYGNLQSFFAHFDGSTWPGNGDTIDDAYINCVNNDGSRTIDVEWAAVDAASPTAPTTRAAYDAASLTTARVTESWAMTTWGAGYNSAALTTIIQELVDTYTVTAIQIRCYDDGNASGSFHQIASYDTSASSAPELYVEWTAGSSAITASAADGVDIGESAARTATFAVSLSDGLSAGSTPGRAANYATIGTDELALAEAVARAVTLLTLASDGVIGGETAVTSKTAPGTAADGIQLAEQIARIATLLAVGADGLRGAETAQAIALLLGVSGDGLTVGDSPVAVVSIDGTAIDGLTLGESLTVTAVLAALAADGTTLSDVTTGLLSGALSADVIDGIVLGESLTPALTALVSALDSVNIGDSPTGLLGKLVSALDSVLIGETAVSAKQTSGVATDGITLGESAAALLVLLALVSDGVQIAETAVGSIASSVLTALATDGVTFTDTGEVNARFVVNAVDGAQFTEVIARILTMTAAISDGLNIGETAVYFRADGEVTISFTAKNCTIEFGVKRPSMAFTGKAPGISFSD